MKDVPVPISQEIIGFPKAAASRRDIPKASDLLFEGNKKHLHKLSRQTFSLSVISPRKVTL